MTELLTYDFQTSSFRMFQKQLRSLQSLVQESKGQLKVAETRLANSNEKLIKAEERLHKVWNFIVLIVDPLTSYLSDIDIVFVWIPVTGGWASDKQWQAN